MSLRSRNTRLGRWLRTAVLALLGAAGFSPAGAEDGRWQYPQQYSISPAGVNLQTGRYSYSRTDVSIGGLSFTRNWGDSPSYTVGNRSLGTLATYSADVVQGWIPPNAGWSHNFNQGVSYWNGSSYTHPRLYVVADGKLHNFIELADGSVVPADQAAQGTRLAWANGQWTLTDRGGAAFTFFAHPAIAQGSAASGLNQVIQSATYADGTRLDYSYTAAGRPRFVKSNRGYAIGLEYDGWGNVSKACGFNLARAYADASTSCAAAAVKASYVYDGTGSNLVSATDSSNAVVTFAYAAPPQTGLSLPSCISLSNSATCEVQNVFGPQPGDPLLTYADQVRRQTMADGKVWTYSYRPAPDPADEPIVVGKPRYARSFLVDPGGTGWGFRYDRGRLVQQATPEGVVEYRYRFRKLTLSYGGGSQPTTLQYHESLPGLIIPPEVNRRYFLHDNRGNLVQQSFWPKGSPDPAAPAETDQQDCCMKADPVIAPVGSITASSTFLPDWGGVTNYGAVLVMGCGAGPAEARLCDKPLSSTDARGNITDYAYDPAHGGVLKVKGPAVNEVRPETRHTYVQRYAWLSAAGGGHSPAATPVWLLASTSACRTGPASGAGCAGGAADEVLTTFDYGPDSGPNNLLLRGTAVLADGTASRTCFAHDPLGNKISETSPRAGLASCP